MYLNKVTIRNIRAIKEFEMTFEEGKHAGWHVLIGDNGSGKSTILRSISLCLFGPEYAPAVVRRSWDNWLPPDVSEGVIDVEVLVAKDENSKMREGKLPIKWRFSKQNSYTSINVSTADSNRDRELMHGMWFGSLGWVSAGFGPFRRFSGGSGEWESYYESTSFRKAAAHLSLFNESVAFPQVIEWLKYLKHRSLENKQYRFLDRIISLVNSTDFLPDNVKLHEVNSDGVFFKDGNNVNISIDQLSDGFRSILSLTFELLRVFDGSFEGKNIINGRGNHWHVDVAGVVLIDEVDVHLHPSWQARIGQWFTKYFPKIQFIVTTHSPIVCRASENGSIWQLAAPGSNLESEEVVGIDKQRLIFGDIHDAYGTQTFGIGVTQSSSGVDMAVEMAALAYKSFEGTITNGEKKRLNELKSIMPTANP